MTVLKGDESQYVYMYIHKEFSEGVISWGGIVACEWGENHVVQHLALHTYVG